MSRTNAQIKQPQMTQIPKMSAFFKIATACGLTATHGEPTAGRRPAVCVSERIPIERATCVWALSIGTRSLTRAACGRWAHAYLRYLRHLRLESAEERRRHAGIAIIGRWPQCQHTAEQLVNVDIVERRYDNAGAKARTGGDEEAMH